MALRKDKIQALKDSLCLDNVDPSTRSALNNLVDNLMDLFDDVALPKLGELPKIDTGEFDFPGDAPFGFPTGGGEPPFFDPLDGFGGPPPGQGGGGPGGPGDPGQEGPEGQPGRDADGQCNAQVLVAKTVTVITAAGVPESEGEEGAPFGVGLAEILHLQPVENEDNEDDDDTEGNDEDNASEVNWGSYLLCREKCRQEFAENFGDGENDEIVDPEVLEGLSTCLLKCEQGVWSLQSNAPPEYLEVRNISCEQIEKDKTIIVSIDSCDLYGYVLVEACGCD